jgi:hypothetical protein
MDRDVLLWEIKITKNKGQMKTFKKEFVDWGKDSKTCNLKVKDHKKIKQINRNLIKSKILNKSVLYR